MFIVHRKKILRWAEMGFGSRKDAPVQGDFPASGLKGSAAA